LPLALGDAGYFVDAVADEGYWTIVNSGITGGIYNVDITAAGFETQDYTKLHLLKRLDEFSDWMLDGSHLPSDGSSSIPVLHRQDLSGFSDFAVGLRGGTLPIELMEFKSECREQSILVSWKTASETNTSKFIIEKSFDLITFFEIESISAAGNSNSLLSYSFDDKNLTGMPCYYRLSQIDLCGLSTLSETIYIDCPFASESLIMSLFPNPVSDVLNVKIENGDIAKYFIELVNDCGKTVFVDKFMGASEYHVDISHLAPGVYTLRLVSDSYVFIGRVVKR
jgi:hypothetical protein